MSTKAGMSFKTKIPLFTFLYDTQEFVIQHQMAIKHQVSVFQHPMKEIKNQHIVVRPGAKVTCPLAMLPFEALLILLPLLSSEEVTDMPLLPSLE
jgi:hypothetical protein